MFEGRIGHLEVKSPWSNAGGVAKTPEKVELLAQTQVGSIEAGSYTLEPRFGNSPNGERVYYHNPDTNETFNSMGKANIGMDLIEQQIPYMSKITHLLGKKLVVNVAVVSDSPVEEARELVSRTYEAGADAVLIAEAQNVIKEDGQNQEIISQDAEKTKEMMAGLRPIVEKYKPVFYRLSTYESYAQTRSVVRQIDPKVVSAIYVSNTFPVEIPRDENGDKIIQVPGEICGMSGPAMADAYTQQLYWVLTSSKIGGRSFDVVSSGGINKGCELKRRLDADDKVVAGCGTTLYYETPEEAWPEATDRIHRELTEAS
jgi:dihydroorotate dehydrogenase